MSLVSLTGASVKLGGRPALRAVDFSVDRGEIVTIVGPNGSGKSTLLRAIVGAERLSAGRITRGDDVRIGYVPQKLHIDPTLPMSVSRFLSVPYRPAGNQRAALRRVGAEGIEERPMAGLSGGQFQRVLLARAILGAPNLLLLDEAARGLDQAGAAAFYRLVASLRAELGCGIVMVSHDLHVVMSASDRVVCLNGHVCCEGTPQVVASAPAYRALFGEGTGGAMALYRHDHDHAHHDAAMDDRIHLGEA